MGGVGQDSCLLRANLDTARRCMAFRRRRMRSCLFLPSAPGRQRGFGGAWLPRVAACLGWRRLGSSGRRRKSPRGGRAECAPEGPQLLLPRCAPPSMPCALCLLRRRCTRFLASTAQSGRWGNIPGGTDASKGEECCNGLTSALDESEGEECPDKHAVPPIPPLGCCSPASQLGAAHFLPAAAGPAREGACCGETALR